MSNEATGMTYDAVGNPSALTPQPCSLDELRETVNLLHAAGAALGTRLLTAYDTLDRENAAELGATFYAECVKRLARDRGTEAVLKRTIGALCNGSAPNPEEVRRG